MFLHSTPTHINTIPGKPGTVGITQWWCKSLVFALHFELIEQDETRVKLRPIDPRHSLAGTGLTFCLAKDVLRAHCMKNGFYLLDWRYVEQCSDEEKRWLGLRTCSHLEEVMRGNSKSNDCRREKELLIENITA